MVEQFCKSILQIQTGNSKALANLVMGLSSQISARSVVEIALNPCYHYQYSSISKSVDVLDKKSRRSKGDQDQVLSRQEVEKKFAYQGGTFFQALREILVVEYRYKLVISTSFADLTSKEVRL